MATLKLTRPHTYAIFLIPAFVAAGVATTLGGAPDELPGIALGSEALLYVERALVIMVAVFLVFVVLARAWRGQLPDEISREGFKYGSVNPEAVKEASGAAEQDSNSEDRDGRDSGALPDDLLSLRLKLEAKMAYIARTLFATEECKFGTYVTIGSLKQDRFLSDEEARTASQVLTLREEELETLPPRLRNEFLRSANTVVGNLRASVFYGIVRETLKKNKWKVREIPMKAKGRPDLRAIKGDERYRIVPRFLIAKKTKRLEKVTRRLKRRKRDTSKKEHDIVVIPDSSRTPVDPHGEPAVMKLSELKARLELVKDARFPG